MVSPFFDGDINDFMKRVIYCNWNKSYENKS